LVVALGIGCTDFKRFLYQGIGRDRWQQPEQVVRALAIAPGQHVADLGSGGGYFTFRLADATGPQGRVYAVDVDPGLNTYVERQARKQGYEQVRVVLAEHDDASIPAGGVDLIFTCNTYHHIEDRVAYFARARSYLRPGGRIAVIDFREPGWLFRRHSVPADVIRSELEAAGYRLEREHDFLPRQSFLVFGPR
jgi:predicted methyltransferase